MYKPYIRTSDVVNVEVVGK